jgi:hypothetical protein
MTLLQRLHDSEIEASINANGPTIDNDTPVTWLVGSPFYIQRTRVGDTATVAEAEAAMSAAAVELFPESNFAKSLEGVA